VEHGDSLGNKGIISSGDVQWMTAGNGIIHQEMPKGDENGKMYGFQLEDGEEITAFTEEHGVRFLLISGRPIGGPVAWYGPIVMNTQEELRVAFE